MSAEEIIDQEDITSESLPENSRTYLIDETVSRFSGAIWADKIKSKEIILAGLGGIGSYVGYLLGKLQPSSIRLYDPDIVESVNLSGQLFLKNAITRNKADSLNQFIRDTSNTYSVYAYPLKYDLSFPTSNIMICGFDNMEARQVFYNNWKYHVSYSDSPEKCILIDGRLAAEEFQVFAITGNNEYDMKRYEDNWLFSSEEAEATICSYKQTAFAANMIGSIMINILVNFIANECDPLIERPVPFMTEYNAELMNFEVTL